MVAAKAKESEQVHKARLKLKLLLSKEHKLVTEKALKEVSNSIQRWLSRHNKERIKLKSKNIELFDENRHTAKISSRYILHLRDQIKHKSTAKKSLKGRIKSSS